MARTKKEETMSKDLEREEDFSEEEYEEEETDAEDDEDVVDEETEAAATLKPKSKDFPDPKSKIEVMKNVIGKMASMESDELCKWWNQTVAQVGSDHFSDAIPDGRAASNKATIDTKPSDAVKESVREDLKALFDADKTLNEEAKSRLETIFEAAVSARVLIEKEEMEVAYLEQLEQDLTEIQEELAEKLDSYLNYCTEQWMVENEVAIDNALRIELAEEFISGLRDLFEENFIDIPETKVDVVDALTERVEELEAVLDEVISENNELKGESVQSALLGTVEEIAEDLTDAEAEKLLALCEDVEFDGDIDNFKEKVGLIKETYFKDGKYVAREEDDLERTNDDEELNEGTERKPVTDPSMKVFVEAISRTSNKNLR